MEWIPDSSDTLVHALHRSRDLLQLLSTRVSEQQGLFQDLIRLQISYANGLFAAINVLASYYRVATWSRRDGDFDLGVLAGEDLEV